MSRYAEGTTVSPDKTEGEIKELLRKHGATGRAIVEQERLRRAAWDADVRRRWRRGLAAHAGT